MFSCFSSKDFFTRGWQVKTAARYHSRCIYIVCFLQCIYNYFLSDAFFFSLFFRPQVSARPPASHYYLFFNLFPPVSFPLCVISSCKFFVLCFPEASVRWFLSITTFENRSSTRIRIPVLFQVKTPK